MLMPVLVVGLKLELELELELKLELGVGKIDFCLLFICCPLFWRRQMRADSR